MILTKNEVLAFLEFLEREEKSRATREKYVRDAQAFCAYLNGRDLTKERVIEWKKELTERGYAVRSINSMVASVNSLLGFLGRQGCRVKALRLQKQTYCPEERELTKAEYLRLLKASQKDRQLNLLLQTICSSGIRVSELRFFTVEAMERGEITVNCKNKTRTILIGGKLRKMLLEYARAQGIPSGPIFRNRKGDPLDRSTIWRRMKGLCARAGVKATKVFPHNLRKLFARTFYNSEKDIAKLADVLGHSSINTTRIYIMTTGAEHRRTLEHLGLILPVT